MISLIFKKFACVLDRLEAIKTRQRARAGWYSDRSRGWDRASGTKLQNSNGSDVQARWSESREEDDPQGFNDIKGSPAVAKCTQKRQSEVKGLSSRMLKQFTLCLARYLWDRWKNLTGSNIVFWSAGDLRWINIKVLYYWDHWFITSMKDTYVQGLGRWLNQWTACHTSMRPEFRSPEHIKSICNPSNTGISRF